jgi:hypothetical protein
MDFEFEKKWRDTLETASKKIGEPLDLQGLLFVIGLQELGFNHRKYSKDQKLEVMHVAICSLLEPYGYYSFIGRDEEGWPHFELNGKLPPLNTEQQQKLIKEAIIEYFESETPTIR